MTSPQEPLVKVAVVYGMLPSIEEVDQLALLKKNYQVAIVSSESIIGFLTQNSFSDELSCIPLPDHDDSTTYLPGLENALEPFDVVIIKGRLGVYAFQVVKAKSKYKFRLLVLEDNLLPYPGEDIQRMRTVREEVSKVADAYLVQTRACAETLCLEGVHEEKIFKWQPWVEKYLERSKPEKRKAMLKLGLHENDFLIVYNGQIEWEEGLLNLLYSVKKIKDQDSNLKSRLKIAFCGIGSFANEIKQRSITLKIDRDILYLAPSREVYLNLLQAADGLFLGSQQGRDRIEGDPYRLAAAMTHGIPVISPRTPLSDELLSKHRLDYCSGSSSSMAVAISKLLNNKSLVHNIVHKNLDKIAKIGSKELIRNQMLENLEFHYKNSAGTQLSNIDQRIIEIESKISNSQYLEAITHIESAFSSELEISDFQKSNLHRLIGDCFTKLGDNDGGKFSYVQAIELDPYSSKAHIGLGTISLTRGNYEIAVIQFQKAVSLSPNDEMANLGLGLSFHGLDELSEAHKWVLKALEINPENSAALYTFVKLSQEREEYDDVEKSLKTYLSLHPQDQNIIYSLAGILFKMSKYSEVIEILQTIVVTNPMDVRAQSLIKQAKREQTKADKISAF